MTTILSLKNGTKSFRTSEVETKALADIDLDVSEREALAITGPSGCGKSTLLNMLGLLDTLDAGTIDLLGHRVDTRTEKSRTKSRRGIITFIFQNFNLIERLSVQRNVEVGLRFLKLSRQEARTRSLEMLEQVGLGHRAQHLPSQLSGGQQQRVAVARALVSRPKLILADEPTGNLDSKNGQAIADLLFDLPKSGSSVVVVTHSKEIAERADRQIVMSDGKIVV
jgi:putative ABC transport system ATP-binding protein